MRNWFFSPLSLVGVTIFCLFAMYSLRSTTSKTHISTEDLRLLDQEVTQLTSEVSRLEKQAAQHQNPFYAEKNIRNELLLQKPGETVVQIPAVSSKSLPTPTPVTSPTPWQEWQAVLWD